jgi:hypothetical protein
MPPLELLKDLPPSEDHFLGVLAEFFSRVQDSLGLLYRSIGVSGVEAEEPAEGTVLPFEFFPILPFQEAVVGVLCGAGGPAHEVQDGRFISAIGKDWPSVDTLEDLGRLERLDDLSEWRALSVEKRLRTA